MAFIDRQIMMVIEDPKLGSNDSSCSFISPCPISVKLLCYNQIEYEVDV